jgi:hypothetical protein
MTTRTHLTDADLGVTVASKAALDAAVAATPAALPSGVMMPYGGTAAPTGWLLCNGAAVSRTTYAALFAAIGIAYGPGDGVNTFNVPDARDRVLMGAGSTYAVGATGGAVAGTPAGTVAAPAFTGAAWTPPAIAWPGGVPTATAPVFTGGAWTPPAIAWPAGVPTAANEGAHTHSVTSNVSGTLTPAGTIAWPGGVPTFAGSALATHQHELPFQKVAGGTAVLRMLASSVFGTGTSRAPESQSAAPTANTTSAAVLLSEAKSAGTPAGTISWPAGVPTFAGTSNQAITVANPAVTSGAGSNHTHTISWPAGVPTIGAYTPAGIVAAPVISWPAGVPTIGAYTPAGTNSAPAFTGASMSILPPYLGATLIIKT